MPEAIPTISPANIDAVLAYLPMLEQPEYRPGDWGGGGYQMPYFSYRPDFDAFVDALFDEGLCFSFDWMAWQDEAKRYLDEPDALNSADLLTIRKLLTAHARADRFVAGHLAHLYGSGHLLEILRRLQTLRRQMNVEGDQSP